MSFPNCCEPWLFFLFTTQYQYIQALIDFMCSFLDWYHHLCHLCQVIKHYFQPDHQGLTQLSRWIRYYNIQRGMKMSHKYLFLVCTL